MITAAELEELGNQWKVEAEPVYPDTRFPPSMYYRFFRRLTHQLRPWVCVELGVCGGGASLYMALGNPDGVVIGVDVVNDYPANILHIQQTCPNFRFWRMDSVDAADFYPNVHIGDVDLLFIDTVHEYDRAMMEFRCWEPWLSDRAIVCLDDLHRDNMEQVWAELPGRKVRMDWLHAGGEIHDGGFGVIFDIRGGG